MTDHREPPPPPGQIPAPYYQSHPPMYQETNVWAVLALIMGILSWTILPVIAAIAAIFCGMIARTQIRQSMGHQTGDGIAIAGMILGAINVVLSIITVCCWFVLVCGMFSIAPIAAQP